MPHVSRIKLPNKEKGEIITLFNSVMTEIKDSTQMDSFLNTILTPTEKLMLAKRLAVVVLIERGFNDSEISSALNITRMTISKIRYHYQLHQEGYAIALNKTNSLTMKKELKSLLESFLKYAVSAGLGGRIPKL